MNIPTPAEVLGNADFLARLKQSLESLIKFGTLTDQNIDKIIAIFIDRDYGALQGTPEQNAAWMMIFARLQNYFRNYYSGPKQAEISPTKNDWAAQTNDFNYATEAFKALRDEVGEVSVLLLNKVGEYVTPSVSVIGFLYHYSVPLVLGGIAIVALIKYRREIKVFLK